MSMVVALLLYLILYFTDSSADDDDDDDNDKMCNTRSSLDVCELCFGCFSAEGGSGKVKRSTVLRVLGKFEF